jgi:hypothetical protein
MSEELKTIELGLDAEEFLRGNVGKALVGKAIEQAMNAMGELKSVRRDTFGNFEAFEAKVMRLQGIIERAENFEGWVIELIQEGRNAEQLVQQNDIVD